MRSKLELRVYSVGGQYIGSLYNVGKASIVDFSFTQKYLGGLIEISVKLDRDSANIIDLNQKIQIWVDGQHIDTGYTAKIADNSSTDKTQTPEIFGGWNLLKNINVDTKTYTSTTLSAILQDLITTYAPLSPLLSPSLLGLNPPVISITTFTVDKTKLSELLKTLLTIANYNWSVTRYRTYVDKDGVIRFEPVNTGQRRMFEGYDYAKADINEDMSNMVNTITICTSSSTPGVITATAITRQDMQSAALYGVRSNLVMVPYVIDTATIQKLGDAILRFADPIESGKVTGFRGLPPHFGGYIVTRSKLLPAWFDLPDVDDPLNWALTGTGITKYYAEAPEPILHGIASLGIACSNANGSYIQYDLDYPIVGPIEMTATVWENSFLAFKIEVLNLGVVVASWDLSSTSIHLKDENGDLYVDNDGDNITLDTMLLIGPNSWQTIPIDLTSVAKMDAVRFTIKSNAATTMYLDQIQIKVKRSATQVLQLVESMSYLKNSGLESVLTVGEPLDNIVDVITGNKELLNAVTYAIARK